jgi:hypothetical protein
VVRTKQPVQINDLRTSPAYLEGDSLLRTTVDMGGARTLKVTGETGFAGSFSIRDYFITTRSLPIIKSLDAARFICLLALSRRCCLLIRAACEHS